MFRFVKNLFFDEYGLFRMWVPMTLILWPVIPAFLAKDPEAKKAWQDFAVENADRLNGKTSTIHMHHHYDD